MSFFGHRLTLRLHPPLLPRLCIAGVLLLASTIPARASADPANPAAPTPLPDAPSALLPAYSSSASDAAAGFDALFDQQPQNDQQPPKKRSRAAALLQNQVEYDKDGKPIPLSQQQPKRILGFMPNFRSVSVGAVVHPPGWGYNFKVATHQAFDYSSFLFLGLTSITAEGLDEHPVLGKGIDGFWGYTWRGFLDKTDGNYLGGWFLPSLLHEDTRYYPYGHGHSVAMRELYVISRQGVTRTYGGRDTPNIAGLGGKVLAQVISRSYYPSGATSFGVLAQKFGYATMRDVIFTSIREFYPDIAAYYVRKHHQKALDKAAADAQESTQPSSKP